MPRAAGGDLTPTDKPPTPQLTRLPMAKIPDKQGLFFELDGVLVAQARLSPEGTVPYLDRAIEALGRIDSSQFRIFVATSRHDIAFGKYREREFTKFCEALLQRMHQEHITITKIYSCPYHPKGKGRFKKESVFRKPGPGIFKMAQQEFDLDLQRSWMIGHTTADVLAGQRAELGTILVKTGQAGKDGEFQVEPHFTEADLFDAIARVNQFEHSLRV